MWEYDPSLNRFGTTESLMLLPYFTDGCIDSMEGLLFESASTTPFHFIDQNELSPNPSNAVVGLPYGGLDVPLGIQHLQQLGVRYLLAVLHHRPGRRGRGPRRHPRRLDRAVEHQLQR